MKAYLFKYDLSAKQFAADIGVSVSYLYQLMRKERRPSLALALKIEEHTKGELTVEQLRLIEEKTTIPNRPTFLNREHVETKLDSLESFVKSLAERIKKLEDFSKPAF